MGKLLAPFDCNLDGRVLVCSKLIKSNRNTLYAAEDSGSPHEDTHLSFSTNPQHILSGVLGEHLGKFLNTCPFLSPSQTRSPLFMRTVIVDVDSWGLNTSRSSVPLATSTPSPGYDGLHSTRSLVIPRLRFTSPDGYGRRAVEISCLR